MNDNYCTQQDAQNFYKFLKLLYGKHQNTDDYIFLLERLPFAEDEYASTMQEAMKLNLARIVNYIRCDDRNHFDFSISPSIHQSDQRYAENISGLYCFWCEFDFGTEGHKNNNQPFFDKETCITSIKQRYTACNLMPSIIFSSGHGIHCYWVCKQNIVEHMNQVEIEKINEYLFQIAIGWNNKHFNEVKSINSMMRTCMPAVNRKNIKNPVQTKIKFTNQIYNVQELVEIVQSNYEQNKEKFQKKKQNNTGYICRIGDISLVENDIEFCQWISDSTDLCYYQNEQFVFDSTSHKESWIFKYLYLCGLDAEEIYEFCCQYLDKKYHIFKRKTDRERIKRIQYEIDKAQYNEAFQKIRREHINQAQWF